MHNGSDAARGAKRARAYGVTIGAMETGRWNALTDVPGVRVGQCTVRSGDGALVPGGGPARTGVTAILPHSGNLFRDKAPVASHIINGFGKSIGLVQVDELGAIATPILLTNTLNVPRVADALIDHMLTAEPGIGIRTTSVNPVVMECNDGHLNDIQGRHVRAAHVHRALADAADGPVAEGSVLIFGTHAANRIPHRPDGPVRTIEATEEAIVNALFAGRGMTGRDNYSVPGLPVERVLAILRAHGRGGDAPVPSVGAE